MAIIYTSQIKMTSHSYHFLPKLFTLNYGSSFKGFLKATYLGYQISISMKFVRAIEEISLVIVDINADKEKCHGLHHGSQSPNIPHQGRQKGSTLL